MKNLLIPILLLFLSTHAFAQNHQFLSPPPFNEADLKKPNSLIDKSAAAEILYKSFRYSIAEDYSVTREYYSRIKIYDKKNAEEWLNITIPISRGVSLDKFQVNIYNLSNGKVENISLNKKDQLKENFTKGLNFYKLAIPNIVDGTVIEYQYTLNTKQIDSFVTYLEYDIPVVYEEFNLEYPDSVTYLFNVTGSMIKPKYHVSTTEDHKAVLYNVFRFGYENIKPVKKELFVKDANRFRAAVKPEFKSISAKKFGYSTGENWNEVATWFDENEKFGGFLKSNVNTILPDEVKNYYEIQERANKVFNFVKSNYKWNRENGINASQSIKELTKTKTGNSADINLLLIALFRSAGIEADPLLISTVDNGILNILTPRVNNLNTVLAAVKIKNQMYFYDATSFNSKVNMLPERDWNDFGILMHKDTGTDISFSNTNISKRNLTVKASLDLEHSEVKGSFNQRESGLYAIESYDEFDFNKDKYNQSFKTKYKADMKEVQSSLIDDADFQSQMNFSSSSLMDVVGNRIIINPLLFLNTGNENFNQTEERKQAIEFISAFTREKKIELEIPVGYTVQDLPKPKKMATDDNEISYAYKAEVIENKLMITSKVDIASPNYPKEYYPFFKQIWKIIADSESQVVSLIKK